MKWFNNLKIRTKLILCFIILAIFTSIVGIVGINSMNNINKASQGMYYTNFVPAMNLSKIQTALEEVRAIHLSAIYERDAETFQEKMDQINNLVQQTNQLLGDYSATIEGNDEAKVLYDALMETLLAYRTVRNENLDMVKMEQYDKALAESAIVSDTRIKVDEALQKLVDYNTYYSESTLKNNTKEFSTQTILMIVVIIVGITLAIAFGLIIATIMSKQLNKLVGVADKIADGDLDVVITNNSKDEVGVLANALRKMTKNINEVMTNINSAAEQVASGSRQLSGSSMALSQGATEQASSIEELTASLEEISSQTKMNAQNANQANELAEVAKTNAGIGNSQMKEMLYAMEEINNSSSNISKIIKVIDDIAFQTNILALNAAVEAARAGQHGKGFAVVAEEVRNLAARSANAAKETTDMIEGSIKKVEGGTKIANETAVALNKIVEDVTKAANLVGEIAIASNEQAMGIEQINQGIMQISEVIQTNSATSEESAAASEELSSQAIILREMVSKFNLKQNTNGYNSLDEINPEVLKMLEKMSSKKNKNDIQSYEHTNEIKNTKHKIDLSDNEFGKY